MIDVHVLRFEWPPWKTFIEERDAALAKFRKASSEARARCDRINDAEDRALNALQTAQGKRADARG